MSAKAKLRPVHVTARDMALLRSLAEYRYLSMDQLERLHFPSAQTTTRRLRQLALAGYVELFRIPTVPSRLALLTDRGQRLLTESGCASAVESSARREAPKDALFAHHFLAISDFRIALGMAVDRSHDLDLLAFIPEYRTAPGKGGAPQKTLAMNAPNLTAPQRSVSHCPDGAFALMRGENAALFFLEVDRGTEVIGDPERGVLKAVRFYVSLLLAGSYQWLAPVFGQTPPFRGFRVLFVVSSEQRLQNIRERCRAVPGAPDSATRFVWLCSQAALARVSPLDVPFVSADPTDTTTYTIAPKEQTERRASWQSA